LGQRWRRAAGVAVNPRNLRGLTLIDRRGIQ
jgi:hypothetical protein